MLIITIKLSTFVKYAFSLKNRKIRKNVQLKLLYLSSLCAMSQNKFISNFEYFTITIKEYANAKGIN